MIVLFNKQLKKNTCPASPSPAAACSSSDCDFPHSWQSTGSCPSPSWPAAPASAASWPPPPPSAHTPASSRSPTAFWPCPSPPAASFPAPSGPRTPRATAPACSSAYSNGSPCLPPAAAAPGFWHSPPRPASSPLSP